MERRDAARALTSHALVVRQVSFKGHVLLYTRSNLSPMGGARHVQVARSVDGTTRWSKFEQIRIRGVRYGPAHAKNNIYFWTVRPLPGTPAGHLAAFFPGVIDLQGGVFFCTSMSARGARTTIYVPYPRPFPSPLSPFLCEGARVAYASCLRRRPSSCVQRWCALVAAGAFA